MARQAMVAWRCRAGHVLGQVVRNGSGVQRLLLYRQAVDVWAEAPAEVEVMALVEGLVMDVRCSVCGEIRAWYPGAWNTKERMSTTGGAK